MSQRNSRLNIRIAENPASFNSPIGYSTKIPQSTPETWERFPIMDSIINFFRGLHDTIVSKMGGVFNKDSLTDFQKAKLLHEFHTFFDLNKDGILEWKDFEVARERICSISGWKLGSPKYMQTKEVFKDIWRYLQDDGDENLDGKITADEWLRMWESLNRDYLIRRRERNFDEKECKAPDWLERYIEYKFHLYDRTGDGYIDEEEFEYVLSDFGVAPKDAKTAFLLFSQNHEQKIDLPYFRLLSIEYFRSEDEAAMGNFITGRLNFTNN